MREIILDTETTGLSPTEGHKICEIGLVELVGRKPTGRGMHLYVNPRRRSDPEAFKVHGLSYRFLRNFPAFNDVKGQVLDFIADSPLVIHNALFDMGFMNHELGFRMTNQVIDTYEMAIKRYPGGRHSLDAMVARLQVKVPERKMHGAHLDAEILSRVYISMMTPPRVQANLFDAVEERSMAMAAEAVRRMAFPSRQFSVSEAEEAAHAAMLADIKNPVWKRTEEPAPSPVA